MRFRSSFAALALLLAYVVLWAQAPQPATGVFVAAPPATGNIVTNSSTLSWNAANLTNVYGYKVQVDALTPVDVGIPTTQAPLVGGGLTFSIVASQLSMANGAHTLTFCAYNDVNVSSTSCPTLAVTKQ